MLFSSEELELEYNCSKNSMLQLVCQILEAFCFDHACQLTVEQIADNERVWLSMSPELEGVFREELCEKINTQFRRKGSEKTCEVTDISGHPFFVIYVTSHHDLENVN